MNALVHTEAETALIASLAEVSGADASGWVAQLRDATIEQGMPSRRHEMWKWSDLRRASTSVTTAGTLDVQGASSTELEPADGAVLDISAHASAGASAHAINVVIKAGRSVRLIERYSGEANSLGNMHFDITIEAGGKLERVCIQSETPDGIMIASSRVELHEEAHLHQIQISLGGKLTRNECHIIHPGKGATVELNGVYLLDEGLHSDFTNSVQHTGPGGITNQLIKGAVAANARGIFQGKFKVEKAAQQTDAKMTHRALMLDERAEIDAKPELEIYADDVQCAHGNAVGALDDTALFYMRQRGLPEAKARALLIESFLAEPLDGVRDETLRDELKAMVRDRLEVLTS